MKPPMAMGEALKQQYPEIRASKDRFPDIFYNAYTGEYSNSLLMMKKELERREMSKAAASSGLGKSNEPAQWNYHLYWRAEPEGTFRVTPPPQVRPKPIRFCKTAVGDLPKQDDVFGPRKTNPFI